MAQTVVGFFDKIDDAKAAVIRLMEAGIGQGQIDISGGQSGNTDVKQTYKLEDSSTRQSGIAKFFNSLFGDDSDDAKKYSSVGGSADTIVTVHAQTDKQAGDSADILDEYGAFNVDERAAQSGYASTATEGGERSRSKIVGRAVEENIRLKQDDLSFGNVQPKDNRALSSNDNDSVPGSGNSGNKFGSSL